MKLLFILCLILLMATACLASVTANGITLDATNSPTTANAPVTIGRLATLSNSNQDISHTEVTNWSWTPDGWILTDNPANTQIIISATVSAPGARAIKLAVNVPSPGTFVSGSLQLNGVAQPDPTIAAGAYTLSLTLPAATATAPSKTTVADKVLFVSP